MRLARGQVKIAKVFAPKGRRGHFATGQDETLKLLAFLIKTHHATSMAKGNPQMTLGINCHAIRNTGHPFTG